MRGSRKIITGSHAHINQVCPLYFRSQTLVTPNFSGVGFNVGAPADAVAVIGHYVYLVLSGEKAVSDNTIYPAQLLIYDLSDLDAPNLVNTIDLDAPGGMYFANPDMAGYGDLDALWISGVYTDGTPLTSTPNPDGTIKYYDISTRGAPSLNTEFPLKVGARWALHRHFESAVYSGNPYLVALDASGQTTAALPLATLDVIDGYSGSVVGTYVLTGSYDAATDPYPYVVMCDNLALVQFDGVLYALDLFDPTTPTLAWSEAAVRTPTVYLGSGFAYVEGSTRLYDDIPTANTNANTFTDLFETVEPNCFFLDGTCLYRVSASNAKSFNVELKSRPQLFKSVTAPIAGVFDNPIDRDAGADGESAILYLCSYGNAGGIAYLTLFSNVP